MWLQSIHINPSHIHDSNQQIKSEYWMKYSQLSIVSSLYIYASMYFDFHYYMCLWACSVAVETRVFLVACFFVFVCVSNWVSIEQMHTGDVCAYRWSCILGLHVTSPLPVNEACDNNVTDSIPICDKVCEANVDHNLSWHLRSISRQIQIWSLDLSLNKFRNGFAFRKISPILFCFLFIFSFCCCCC